MRLKPIRSWKKVFEKDLSYIAFELRDLVSTPAFIMLEGPLGAGKTTFSKVFTGDPDTMSPTYSLLSEYSNILHGDFYRIKTREDIIQLELELYLENKDYFLAEWSKKHFHSIDPELSEEFESYLLEITINSFQSKLKPELEESEVIFSRNFVLSRVIPD